MKKCGYKYNGILFRHERNEILPFTTTRTDLENIKLSELSQTGKDKCGMISLAFGIYKKKKKAKFIETEYNGDRQG